MNTSDCFSLFCGPDHALEEALTKMRASIESGRLKDEAVAQRRLGRLQERYWRAAAAFEIKIAKRKQPNGKARLSIAWKQRQSWSDWTALSEGCYLLRTNLTESDPATLWKRYIQLTEAEWAFRIEKDELGIRPIWHQKEDRVLGHILVCFLGYVLWKALAQWMRRAGSVPTGVAIFCGTRRPLIRARSAKRRETVQPVACAPGSDQMCGNP